MPKFGKFPGASWPLHLRDEEEHFFCKKALIPWNNLKPSLRKCSTHWVKVGNTRKDNCNNNLPNYVNINFYVLATWPLDPGWHSHPNRCSVPAPHLTCDCTQALHTVLVIVPVSCMMRALASTQWRVQYATALSLPPHGTFRTHSVGGGIPEGDWRGQNPMSCSPWKCQPVLVK